MRRLIGAVILALLTLSLGLRSFWAYVPAAASSDHSLYYALSTGLEGTDNALMTTHFLADDESAASIRHGLWALTDESYVEKPDGSFILWGVEYLPLKGTREMAIKYTVTINANGAVMEAFSVKRSASHEAMFEEGSVNTFAVTGATGRYRGAKALHVQTLPEKKRKILFEY